MKNPFQTGHQKVYELTVKEDDVASFEAESVHPVYATFALARDIEWACRLFVLEMKEDDEEGIGTMIEIEHLSPALVGSKVKIVATVESVEKNEIICTYEAFVGERVIAKGRQGQKILKKTKISDLFAGLNKS